MTASTSSVSYPVPSIPTRLARAATALYRLGRDPGRLDQVLVLGEAVNLGAIRRNLAKLESNPEAVKLFAEKPRIDRANTDWEALRALPEGTLGRAYVRFLDSNGITPEPFESKPNVGDPRAAYVMTRMRQTHDLWHVLTGYPADVRGEILLQAFTYAQLGSPSSLLITILGALRATRGWHGQLTAMRAAYAHGKRVHYLPTFRWEEHWATPVRDLRTMLAA